MSYQQAFALVDHVHYAYLNGALKVCQKLGLQSQKKNYREKNKLQIASINNIFKNYLDSICKRDQEVRTSKYLKARNYYFRSKRDSAFVCKEKKYVKSKNLMQEWWATDSANIELLKQFISKNGFPGEKMVGWETTHRVSIILLHYDKDTANHVMGEILKKTLYNGDLSPQMYAWIIDRHLLYAGKPQMYYTIPPSVPIQQTQEEHDIINSNRESIGLKKFEKMKITNRKKNVSVRYK